MIQNSGSLLRRFKNQTERKNFLEKHLNINLNMTSSFSFTEQSVSGRNIENLVGAIQIPLGVAGPVSINGKDYYLPLATTEGALVASISRGCKALSLSGGAASNFELVGMTRGPVFKVKSQAEGLKIKQWILENFGKLKKEAAATSKHIELLKSDFALSGKSLFVRFYFDCNKAMGMNMATFATAQIVKLIENKTKAECVSLAGNYDIDKKSAWLNFINGRGRRVWAEVLIGRKIVKDILKTTPERIKEVVYRKSHMGSILSGSLGFNAHFANIVAALYVATGQDLAHVTEGSLGITTAEVEENGDLYFSVYLPAVETGVIGGGTTLPTQKEALSILNLNEKNPEEEFATIVGGATLAGELSLTASLAEDSLVCAHKTFGRGKKK